MDNYYPWAQSCNKAPSQFVVATGIENETEWMVDGACAALREELSIVAGVIIVTINYCLELKLYLFIMSQHLCKFTSFQEENGTLPSNVRPSRFPTKRYTVKNIRDIFCFRGFLTITFDIKNSKLYTVGFKSVSPLKILAWCK